MLRRCILLLLLLALPVLAAGETLPASTPVPASDSLAEGYVAPATPTPQPTPEAPPLRDDPMLINAVELAGRIDLLAENELFRNLYLTIYLEDEAIEALSWGDHVRPQRVCHMQGRQVMDALNAGSEAPVDFMRPEFLRDLALELPEIFWGRREETELAVLYLISRSKTFALPGAEGFGLFILLYEEAAPVAVSWHAQRDCVQMSAFFVPDKNLAGVRTPKELSAWFADFGMPLVVFEEVPLT